MRWKNPTPDMLIEKMISIAGTADGRPCYVIQNASAEKKFAIVAGRANAKAIRTILTRIAFRQPPVGLSQKRQPPFLIRIGRAPAPDKFAGFVDDVGL